MRKVTNKKGFTLTEIIIVIAIIVILAGSLAAGIAIDLNKYKQFQQNLEATGGGNWEKQAISTVDAVLPTITAEPSADPSLAPITTTAAPTTATPTSAAATSAASTTVASTTAAPSSTAPVVVTSKAPEPPASSPVTRGNTTANNGFATGDHDKGVVSLSDDGKTIIIKNDSWNCMKFTVSGSGNNMKLTVVEGNLGAIGSNGNATSSRYFLEENVFQSRYNTTTWTLTTERKTWLSNNYGLTFK